MEELIRRSLRLWHQGRRPGASSREIEEAMAAIPELCAALDAEAARGREAERSAWSSYEELERFCRHLVHEVRNRLNLIDLSLERTEIRCEEGRVRSALEPARRAVRHLGDVVEDMQWEMLPSPEEAAELHEPTRAPLREVMDDLLTVFHDQARGLGVRLEIEGQLPDVEVDAARLELILFNLLTNALRHVDPSKSEPRVTAVVRRLHEEGCWQIGVVDNGVGIPAAQRAGIFQESERRPGEDAPRSGLGLAIVRRTVEHQGGKVWLESEEGVGTSVYFTLPDRSERGSALHELPRFRSTGKL